jgi:ABC-type multidrug transport system fused ATPase/permease subunit
VATFIGGFVIAFVKGWLLSLVMLACIPPVVIAGGVVSKMLAKISTKGQASYSDAGNIVEQTLGAIKTVSSKALLSDESLHFSILHALTGFLVPTSVKQVVSFNGEKQAIALYTQVIQGCC